ncbi:uracil-DNA glycosylase family protein [Candidatus Gracilibacteria bacterium]|nr:uracil-DNA glycosylase family protein [Candidatus Gracilibacteria bacterium]
MSDIFSKIFTEICDDPFNVLMREKGYKPLYTANSRAKIVIVGQAPGRLAQETQKPWNDKSGETLREWLGVTAEQFYNPEIFSLLPMDFYYPGKGKNGDLPPRKGFAEKWHPILIEHMPNIQLFVLIGAYAQKFYLGNKNKKNLTETVRAYQEFLPKFFPIVHPSPLNFRWRKQNPWFENEIIPVLQNQIHEILANK